MPWRSCCCAQAFKVKLTAVLSHCIGFFVQDRSTGILRFASADIASKALEEFLAKAEDQQTMAGTKTTWRKVEGEEEEKYYDRVSHGPRKGKGSSASSVPLQGANDISRTSHGGCACHATLNPSYERL